MTDKNFSKKLDKEAKLREKIIDETLKSLENMSNQKVKDKGKIEQYKINEIKYKTTIRELNDYIEIYKKKLQLAKDELEKYDKEVKTSRKKILKTETTVAALKSIVELMIKQYGIDTIVDITKIDQKKIESYIGD